MAAPLSFLSVLWSWIFPEFLSGRSSLKSLELHRLIYHERIISISVPARDYPDCFSEFAVSPLYPKNFTQPNIPIPGHHFSLSCADFPQTEFLVISSPFFLLSCHSRSECCHQAVTGTVPCTRTLLSPFQLQKFHYLNTQDLENRTTH